ncbi:hypothetical protein [Bordetella genomosp. 11]|uniref:Uncharacterized protein n=1 Tax=Bordetella genomosp. 11 TaxID=1416808 RepID=A0A261V012_9BORD|nr:hypothetical protein [Bordetella genomosp. 11]OZI66503.1 hypothetical protein CAL28_01840 [Bordetella genomosp. 11]
MTATFSATSAAPRTSPPGMDHPADSRPDACACHALIAAFESVPGLRRKREASDEVIVECLDAASSETEPATMVQRIPV